MSATTTPKVKMTGKEWKISVDQTGNGSAVIRFFPPKGEEILLGASLDTWFPRFYWKVVY